jgi:uncharacterized protein YabE (DUF348 family)
MGNRPNGRALGGLDYSVPAPDAALSPGMSVQIVRVVIEDAREEFPIPFETIYVPDPDLELDQQRLMEEGEPGILERQRRVRTENGLVVSEVVAGEWVARQPRARVIGYGTRIVIRTIQTPYGPLEYWRRLHVLATSYGPDGGDKQPGDPFFGLSATGAEVVRAVMAADPRRDSRRLQHLCRLWPWAGA